MVKPFRIIMHNKDLLGELNHDFEVASDRMAQEYTINFVHAMDFRRGWEYNLWDMTPGKQKFLGKVYREPVVIRFEAVGAKCPPDSVSHGKIT
jgi:hypothetical protein